MYRVDVRAKELRRLDVTTLSEQGLKERFDLEEWAEKSPEILGEDLLIIAKEYTFPSGARCDLLAVGDNGALVVIELKRGMAAGDVEWQAIKYAAQCAALGESDILSCFAGYLQRDEGVAKERLLEFLGESLPDLNGSQRIILGAADFQGDVAAAVLWLRDYEVDIKCVRIRLWRDGDGGVFLTSDVVIPLPEASDFIKKREARKREASGSVADWCSAEPGDLDVSQLEQRLVETLTRESDLTPRLVLFLKRLLAENRTFSREEIKGSLLEAGEGRDLGQAGRYLSNLSQFLTKRNNTHLRQIVQFTGGTGPGEMKDDYRIAEAYRDLVGRVLDRVANASGARDRKSATQTD